VGVAVEQEPISERTLVQPHDALVGGVFDRRFRIEAKIAAGGFGAIYRATHIKSGHQFALKVLHPNLTGDPGVVARFRREGAALTRLRDPHTITAYELGEADDGMLYIVMELLRGESLYERFRVRGRLPWQRVVAIARAVCSSLAEAHALGIIHRDLKPTNIHLEPRGNDQDFVKVLDFGIAKILQDSEIDSSELTQAGQMIGTLDYMSPEQMVGGECTATSDIYSLGVVMYEMIAGTKPFDHANSPAAALAAVLTTTPPRLSTRSMVTPELDRIVMRCLERQHTDRFQSAIELATALDEILPNIDEVVTRVATGHRNAAPAIPKAALVDPDAISTNLGADPEAPSVDPDTMRADPRAAMDTHPVPVDPSAMVDPEAKTLDGIPVIAKPASRAAKPAPVAQKFTPLPESVALSSTLVGHPRAERVASVARMRKTATPAAGTPFVSSTNLREAYPTIHHPPPSPMHPPQTSERSTSTIAPFDMAQAVHRDAVFRRLALGVAIAIAIIVGFLIAGRL
jgi:serine/threonine protein kinase